MLKRSLSLSLMSLMAMLVLSTACTAPPSPESPTEAEVPSEPTFTPEAAQPEGSPSSTEQPTPTETAQAIWGRPLEPAPIDGDFRPDPADIVAATGNPQLIEFFAFW